MDFKDVLLITDVDGTLISSDMEVSEKDLKSIGKFRENGGKFTIATGRGYLMAKPIVDRIKLDMPAVIFNGAAVYDFNKEKFLWHARLDCDIKSLIRTIIDNFPDVGIEVLCEKSVYVPAINDVEREHLKMGFVTPVFCSVDEVPTENVIKLLVVFEKEKLDNFIQFADKNLDYNVSWVRSGDVYYECLPKGVNKGTALKKLIEISGNDDKYVVAVGDYLNDLELLDFADLSLAVSNAHEAAKAVSDVIICSNDEAPIDYIMDKIFNKRYNMV